jgi:transcriptional antiterminator NusG
VKAFKGYVYVSMHMDVDSWHLIKSTQRVVGFVGGQNLTKVRPVTGREVELLGFSRREAPVAQETIVEVELKYQSGDLVEIIDGPFASYVGEVQDVDAGQELIKLLINPSYTVSEARETRSRFASEVTFQAEVAFSQVKPIEL